mmetsp:Transcript_16048/g.32612  ORF Transcript_16048/g.32612 Transcript_16048/m.32612 type:complete len:88 (-) Transcript_16048:24-287(-)
MRQEARIAFDASLRHQLSGGVGADLAFAHLGMQRGAGLFDLSARPLARKGPSSGALLEVARFVQFVAAGAETETDAMHATRLAIAAY